MKNWTHKVDGFGHTTIRVGQVLISVSGGADLVEHITVVETIVRAPRLLGVLKNFVSSGRADPESKALLLEFAKATENL